MDEEQLAATLGKPAFYEKHVREAVARLVSEPLEAGWTIDETLDSLIADHELLLSRWLNSEPDYPIIEALTVTQLACDFARFVIAVRKLTAMIPDEILPQLVHIAESLEVAGINSGDWSWCLSVVEHLIADTSALLDKQDPPASAN
jgi:hypothetical protein